MTTPGDASLAGLASLVAAELANPTGSEVLIVTTADANLTDPASLDELRHALHALVVGEPGGTAT